MPLPGTTHQLSGPLGIEQTQHLQPRSTDQGTRPVYLPISRRPQVGFSVLMSRAGFREPARFRLMHHAHLCQTSGDSIRLTQALAGKGVIPLN